MTEDDTPALAAALPAAPIREIIHGDRNAFFATLEQRDHPELRGQPVAVGGSAERGVLAAANYEARRFGVQLGHAVCARPPAMPGAGLCPAPL
ncbi:MAG: polymerase [Roseomonas sp.]|nr:polymerase [Roseomonas sp.]